jgi:hypothetical protein
MTPAIAFQLAIALLPLVETGVQEFIAWIESLKSTLQQTDEWTNDQDVAFKLALLAKTGDPAYKPDPPKA